jgi:outer membrane beta-barrel protein
MKSNWIKGLLIFGVALLLQRTAFADEVVELPQEELARESVLPVFDKTIAVKNRNIVTQGRFDADIFYGMALTEPISDVSKFGLGVYYNFNEDHALGVMYEKNSTGLSSYANQLNSQYQLDFNRAPKPDSTMMLDYNLKMFYGKMSLTKSAVFNTMLYASASGGIVKYQNKSYPAGAIGVGQKFFFTNRLALKIDLRLYAHQAPSPFLSNPPTDGVNTNLPAPQYSEFQDRMTYTTNLDVGLSYLF